MCPIQQLEIHDYSASIETADRRERLLCRLGRQYLTFEVVVAGVLIAIIYYLVPQSTLDPDIWWHLRDAEWQLQAHSFLRQDVFSYSVRGAPWIDHEWLAEVPFYIAWRLMHTAGLYAVTLLSIEITFLGVFYLAWRRSGSPVAALFISVAGAFISTVSFGPRTLLFGWMALVAELVLLDRFRQGRWGIHLLPVIFAFWINLHGSCLIGMVLLAIFFLGGLHEFHFGVICNNAWNTTQRRQLLLIVGFSVAALFVNPYGQALIAYPFDLAFHQKLNIATIEEWRTLDFHSLRGKLFFAYLAAMFLLQLVRQKKWSLYDLGFLIVGVYAALCYSRFLFLGALLIMPLTASLIATDNSIRKARVQRPLANLMLLAMLAPLVVIRLPRISAIEREGEDRFPAKALPFLQGFHPRGNVFNDYLWGGFLILNTRQDPVLIDSRVDIYERSGVFLDYLDAVQLNNTFQIFEKYKIRYVVFRNEAPLVYLLRRTAGWKVDYEDATAIVLEQISR